jgi:uroporphyrinogen decarboxylase
MSRRDRVRAAIAGEPVDRVPAALWRHFPIADLTSRGLAQAVVDFQRANDFDLVKVTHASSYPAEAWGGELVDDANTQGTRRHVSRVIGAPADWSALPAIDISNEVYARELRALQLVRAGVGDDVHVLATVFSPFTIAKQLYGPDIVEHTREHPSAVEGGLMRITEVTGAFAAAALESGADGIFFATQFARRDLWSVDEYRRFGLRYDLRVLESVRGRADLLMLHMCGANPMFDLAPEYQAHVVNWEDRTTAPSLAEALTLLPSGAVCGGVRQQSLVAGTPDDVARDVRWAIQQTGGRRLVVGTGCVTLVTAAQANVRALRDAVEP